MSQIDIYTQPLCPYCARAKALLTQKGAVFNEIDAPRGSAAREEVIHRSGGRTTVPQIFINTQHIGGCDDLLALDARGELDKLLVP